MRDILIDSQKMLNDNRHMDCHAIISALCNELVKARCELEDYKQAYLELKQEIKYVHS